MSFYIGIFIQRSVRHFLPLVFSLHHYYWIPVVEKQIAVSLTTWQSSEIVEITMA
jgi:hypothetical protein